MITLDTNVLVRALVDDPNEQDQCRIARKEMSKAKTVYVPQIIQAELFWVLSSAYKFSKSQIVDVLEHLSLNMAFVLQGPDVFSTALQMYRSQAADFADYLICVEAELAGASPVVTFDRKFGKGEGVRKI